MNDVRQAAHGDGADVATMSPPGGRQAPVLTMLKAWCASAAARLRASPEIAFTIGASLTSTGLAFLTGILTARLLGPEGRGELAAIQLWPLFLGTIATLGLDRAQVVFGSREGAELGRQTATALCIRLALGFLLMPVGWVLIPFALEAQAPWIIDTARLFLISIPIAQASNALHELLRARGAFGWWNLVRIYPTTSFFLILCGAYLLDIRSPTFLVYGVLAYSVALLPLMIVPLRRWRLGPWRPELRLVRPLLSFGSRVVFASVPQILNARLDQLLMAALLEPVELGYYVAAVAWSCASLPITSAIAPVLLRHMAATESDAAARKRLSEYLVLTCAIVLVSGLAVLVTAPVMVPLLFGTAFAPAIAPALVLSVGAMALGVNQTLEDGLSGAGAPGAVGRAEVIGAVATAVLLWFLLVPYKALGAAVASTLAYWLVSCVLLFEARRTIGLRPADLVEAVASMRPKAGAVAR